MNLALEVAEENKETSLFFFEGGDSIPLHKVVVTCGLVAAAHTAAAAVGQARVGSERFRGLVAMEKRKQPPSDSGGASCSFVTHTRSPIVTMSPQCPPPAKSAVEPETACRVAVGCLGPRLSRATHALSFAPTPAHSPAPAHTRT